MGKSKKFKKLAKKLRRQRERGVLQGVSAASVEGGVTGYQYTAPVTRVVTPARCRTLTLHPLVFLELKFLMTAKGTEVSGFGLSRINDPLYIEDLLVAKQTTTAASVDFDDEGLADLTDDMLAKGIIPERYSGVWIHTHPGASTSPSGKDETTFAEAFAAPSWAVMAILGTGGAEEGYARLRFKSGAAGPAQLVSQVMIGMTVDWGAMKDVTPEILVAARAKWDADALLITERQYAATTVHMGTHGRYGRGSHAYDLYEGFEDDYEGYYGGYGTATQAGAQDMVPLHQTKGERRRKGRRQQATGAGVEVVSQVDRAVHIAQIRSQLLRVHAIAQRQQPMLHVIDLMEMTHTQLAALRLPVHIERDIQELDVQFDVNNPADLDIICHVVGITSEGTHGNGSSNGSTTDATGG